MRLALALPRSPSTRRLGLLGLALLLAGGFLLLASLIDGGRFNVLDLRVDQLFIRLRLAIYGRTGQSGIRTIGGLLDLLSLPNTLLIAGLLSAALLFARRGWQALIPWAVLCTVPVEAIGKLLITQPGRATVWAPFGLALENSFPSGHAARSSFLFGLLISLCWRYWPGPSRLGRWLVTLGLGLFLVLFWLGLLYLRWHTFTDVVGGAAVGFPLLLTCLAFFQAPARRSRGRPGGRG